MVRLEHDMLLSESTYFGTAGAAVHIVEPQTRTYRDSTVKDLTIWQALR